MTLVAQIIIFLTFAVLIYGSAENLSESERVEVWHERGNVWPPNWQEESPSKRKLMDFREKEILSIPGGQERWDNWIQFTQSRLIPSFTPKGFDVIQTPENVHKKLALAIERAVRRWENIPYESDVEVIYNSKKLSPKFVSIGQLAWDVAEDLKELHEEWSGMKLIPTSSYGVRLYQNGSSLAMHYDKVETHVISSIVHIAHKYDNDDEPWPIEIEDHDGNLHEVNLEAGQMLFYESAKCLHGRMKELKGQYYGSIFVHYKPVDTTIWNYSNDDVTVSVPPHWGEGVIEEIGSRWAGSSITVDSRISVIAPPRTIFGIPIDEYNKLDLKTQKELEERHYEEEL